jgi:protein TonB
MYKAFVDSLIIHAFFCLALFALMMGGGREGFSGLPSVTLDVSGIGTGGGHSDDKSAAPAPAPQNQAPRQVYEPEQVKEYEAVTTADEKPAKVVKKIERKKPEKIIPPMPAEPAVVPVEPVVTPAAAKNENAKADGVADGKGDASADSTGAGNSASVSGKSGSGGIGEGHGGSSGVAGGDGGTVGIRDVDVRPKFITRTNPIYPLFAFENGVQGRVLVSFIVEKDGSVENIRVIRSHPKEVFDSAAVDAVRHWKFTPAQKNGAKVRVLAYQEIKFSLDR